MFVEVNNRIWDYEEYKRRLILMKNYSLHEVKEALAPHGFTQQGHCFYNKELDLKIKMQFVVGKPKCV